MKFKAYLNEATKTLGELKDFTVKNSKVTLTINDYSEDSSFTFSLDLSDLKWKNIGKSAYRLYNEIGDLDYNLDLSKQVEKKFKQEFIDNLDVKDNMTLEDIRVTDDWMYALTPAMEKVFSSSKVKLNWNIEFPSIEGKTKDSKFIFGISINGDTFKSLSFMVILDSGEILLKDVANIKDSLTVKELNNKAYSFKRELQQEFKDIQTILGNSKDIKSTLEDDGYSEVS